jgi:phage tail P2-like protein
MNKPSLLPPAAGAFERHAEQATARLEDVPPNVRKVWNPDTCPAAMLPWLAWAFGVEDWKDYWPEATKRAVIRNSIPLRRHRGTRAAVEHVVRSFGSNLLLQEWWETTPPGTPHTFAVIINYGAAQPAITAEYQQDIARQLDRAKPLRSHYALSVGLKAAAQINVIGYLRAGTYSRLQLAG